MGQHTIGRRLRAGVGAGAPATSGEVASNDREMCDVLGTPRAWQGATRTDAPHQRHARYSACAQVTSESCGEMGERCSIAMAALGKRRAADGPGAVGPR